MFKNYSGLLISLEIGPAVAKIGVSEDFGSKYSLTINTSLYFTQASTESITAKFGVLIDFDDFIHFSKFDVFIESFRLRGPLDLQSKLSS